MTRATGATLRARRSGLRSQLRGYLFRVPERRLQTLEQRLDQLLGDAAHAMANVWSARRQAARRLEDVLRLSDPGLPLRRGYSLTFAAGSSRPLRNASDVSAKEKIMTRLSSGRLTSRVEEVNPG